MDLERSPPLELAKAAGGTAVCSICLNPVMSQYLPSPATSNQQQPPPPRALPSISSRSRRRKAQELSTAQPPTRGHSHYKYHFHHHHHLTNHRVPPRKPSKNRREANRTHHLSSHRRPSSARDGVQQQADRDAERDHVPPVRAGAGGGHLAGRARRRHRVRAVPLGARHRAGGLPHGGLRGRARRRLLPRHVAPLGLPRRHVRPHRRPPLLHRLRLRRHPPRRRRGRLRPRLQGVQARRLLQLAAEEGGEHQELEQDQELPPGRQGLQEPPGQEGDLGPVHENRSLPHRVRVLQAPHQLRLHLRQQHAVDGAPRRRHQLDGSGLQKLGQRRGGALLRLPVVQGRRGGHAEARLEARRHRQHRLPRLHHHRLLRRLLRLQEQPQGQPQQWWVRPRRRLEARRIRLIGFGSFFDVIYVTVLVYV